MLFENGQHSPRIARGSIEGCRGGEKQHALIVAKIVPN
jgi:hypothetical protein